MQHFPAALPASQPIAPPPQLLSSSGNSNSSSDSVVMRHHLSSRMVASLPSPVRSLLARMLHASTSASSALLSRAHASLLKSSPLYASVYSRLRALPIVEFYLYMWRVDPTLFVNTMFVNYGLPLLLESMPWYLSRRSISKLLRESRNSITHRLVANEAFSDSAIGSFVLFSVVYALLQTLEQVLRTRVLLSNRLLIKRLVLERILYSELGSLQSRYLAVFGEEVRTEQLEAHVFNDINETIHLFNSTLPSLLRGAYTLVGSAHELWQNKDAFDILAIARPTVVGLISEVFNYIREKTLVESQTLQSQRNASAMSRVVTNIMDGLAEIQIHNLQRMQLRRLDEVSGEELATQQGLTTFVNNVYRQVSNRSVFDFASEVYVVRLVMRRRNINHETYRKVQNDIDYVTRLFGRLWAQARDGYRIYETQERVIALLNLPTFIQEAKLRDKQILLNEAQQLLPADEVGLASAAADGQSTAQLLDSSLPPTPAAVAAEQPLPSLPDASSSDSAAPSNASESPPSNVASTAPPSFEFQSLLFRRCAFRYKPDLPLALNIHPRVPGEEAEDESEECEDSDATLMLDRSTQPLDLLQELEHVAQNKHLPMSTLRSISLPHPLPPLLPYTLPPSTAPRRSHPSSLVLADLMQSTPLADDEDADDDGLAEERMLDEQDPPLPVVPQADAVKELEQLLRQKQLAGTFLEFRDPIEAAAPMVAPKTVAPPTLLTSASRDSSIDSTASSSSPPPAPSSSPSSSSASASPACEPGTLLFERGKTYALVGVNRSGKSSLVQLLCKLYQPAPGDAEIVLNGSEDFTQLPRMLLRDRVSYIAQRPFLFPGSIEDNIRMGNTRATAEEVEQAAEMAGIFSMDSTVALAAPAASAATPSTGSLVDRSAQGGMEPVLKPWEQNRVKTLLLAGAAWARRQWMRMHGFEHVSNSDASADSDSDDEDDSNDDNAQREEEANLVKQAQASQAGAAESNRSSHPTLRLELTERGSNLSGGFAQSVALARVFLRKEAQIVILDEAMGQMDTIKKRELIFPRLFDFIRRHGMTLLMISHDVPLVCKLVDQVYVMSHGECVQAGSHAQLMKQKGGAYARLVGEAEKEERQQTQEKEEAAQQE